MERMPLMLFCAWAAIVCISPSAWAIPPFSDAFLKKYVDGNTNKEFLEAVTAAKCKVCHLGTKLKKDRNAYGQALAELLDKKADAKNLPKINDALDKVAEMKVPENDQTFGDLIEAGKLPGGPK